MSYSKTVEIYAHRGIPSLLPENTLIGFEKSLKIGVSSLDIDVAITKDNIIVGAHDPYLNKDLTRYIINNKPGEFLKNNNIIINNLTFAELKNYDIGKINPDSLYFKDFESQQSKDNVLIPSLQEVIDLIKNNIKDSKDNKAIAKLTKIQIEIKTNPRDHDQIYIENFVKNIIDVLVKNNFVSKAELQSFDWRTLLYAKVYIKQLGLNIKTSYITQQNLEFNSFSSTGSWTAGYQLKNYNNSVPYMISELGGDIWCPDYKDLNKSLVDEAHKNNVKVVPWTVDSKQDMLMLIDYGVDGIITNKADLLREVLSDNLLTVPDRRL